MKTSNIWREQSFAFIDEASAWLSRDFYGNDVEGVLADLEAIQDWVEGMFSYYRDYKEFSLDNPASSVVG